MNDVSLDRIAAALERLVPPPLAIPRGDAAGYMWRNDALAEMPVSALPLDLLTGIDAQKVAVLENTRRHAHGRAAHDALLWGARGMGKSALVKACVAAVVADGHDIALVSMAADAVAGLPTLFATLAKIPRPIMLFIDDLGFDDDVQAARVLRSVLDGGPIARPAHVRLIVTSNRRHIVARNMAEQDSAINMRDVIDDRLALADRFGLSVGFHACDQVTWLAMVSGYARAHDLQFDPADALTFAAQRGARSGRVAWHYVVELAGRAGRTLNP